MKNIQWLKLIISLILPQLAGFIGSIFTRKSIPIWYTQLDKPSFTPPSWIFAPAWITLYLLMGISLYLIWKEAGSKELKFTLTIFFVQLALNSLWSIIFFGLRNPGIASIEIIVLWIMIILCIIYFYKINPISSYLLIPYLLWVTYAAALTISIWKLNSN